MTIGHSSSSSFDSAVSTVFQPEIEADDSAAGLLGSVCQVIHSPRFREVGSLALETPRFSVRQSVGQGGVNAVSDVEAVRTRLHELGYDWADVDPRGDPTTAFIDALRLFQAAKNGQATWINSDGLVEPGHDTERWLQAANAPRWVRFEDGGLELGYRYLVANPDWGDDRYCTHWTAAVIRAAGLEYRRLLGAQADAHPPITVHELSEAQGRTSGHAGHRSGLMFDIRLPRLDGEVGAEVASPQYDRATTRTILHALRAQQLIRDDRLYLEDDVLIAEGLCLAMEDHHNHIHARIAPPARGRIETVEIVGPPGSGVA